MVDYIPTMQCIETDNESKISGGNSFTFGFILTKLIHMSFVNMKPKVKLFGGTYV